MFLQDDKDILFSAVAFSLIGFVRNLEALSIQLSGENGEIEFQKWYLGYKTELEELGFTTTKSAWCWARMVEKNLEHKQPRKSLAMNGVVCEYCKVAEAEEVDHIWPLSLGGPMDDEGRNGWNFVSSCRWCNSIKGNAPIACTVRSDFLLGLVKFATAIYGVEFPEVIA